MSSRRLLLITIGLVLVVLALIGWAVEALLLPRRGLGALNTRLNSDRNRARSLRGD
ncbi:MAG TPA: hypothetical protein VFU10_04590 [Gaiellaceae bacterium]|nr:hypothetical protein [Gaiellaceae bacterium]